MAVGSNTRTPRLVGWIVTTAISSMIWLRTDGLSFAHRLRSSLPVASSAAVGLVRAAAASLPSISAILPLYPAGHKGGRPRKIDDADAAKVRQLREKGIAANDIAKMLGVSRATVYRYLSDGASLAM
jgi:hypothetical protein